MLVKMVGATDVGRRRKTNQDSLFFDANAGFGIVADGIGGRSGGEVASSMAVNGLRRVFTQTDRGNQDDINGFLSHAVEQQNLEIIERGRRDPELVGMGTTLNCLVFLKERLYIAHLGDSRTYLFFKKHLFQLTLDHSVANFLERGWIPKSAVQPGSRDGALVKALGLSERCEADVYNISLKPGALFLTCSDGLTSMIGDEKICQLLINYSDSFDQLPNRLIDAANQVGGKDNITVLCSLVTD